MIIKPTMLLEDLISPKYYEILERNNICTVKQIILLTSSDIKKLTNLTEVDIKVIKDIVSQNLEPQLLTCHKLLSLKPIRTKVSSGCHGIDLILCGGFRTGTITEIYGESGTGKTQIGLHTTVYNWAQGCVYICTEDLFPVKRYEQMKRNIPNYCSNVDYGKNTYIEHITEPDELLSCVRVRLPKLLSQTSISLIVIDSVAAPFRVESANFMQRADDLRQLANSLINIAQVHNLAVLCINQVTASFNTSSHNVIPSLGLAWSNMICSRLYLKKTDIMHVIPENKNLSNEGLYVNIRELSVEFAPHLPFSNVKIMITSSGIIAV